MEVVHYSAESLEHKKKEPPLKLLTLPTENKQPNLKIEFIKEKLDDFMDTLTHKKEESDSEKLKANENIDDQLSDDYSKQECTILSYLSSTLDDMLAMANNP